MVFFFFVNEFDLDDSRLVVAPKDGDNLNAWFKNLALINKSDMMIRTYNNGRSREAFSNKPKKIRQYDQEGNMIKEYSSISEIEKEIGFDLGIISDVVKRENNEYRGFIWKYEEELLPGALT